MFSSCSVFYMCRKIWLNSGDNKKQKLNEAENRKNEPFCWVSRKAEWVNHRTEGGGGIRGFNENLQTEAENKFRKLKFSFTETRKYLSKHLSDPQRCMVCPSLLTLILNPSCRTAENFHQCNKNNNKNKTKSHIRGFTTCGRHVSERRLLILWVKTSIS